MFSLSKARRMEAHMKKTFYLAAAAALLMASSAAQAGGINFEINGQRIHVDAPRNCNSLSCLTVTNNGSSINLKNLNLNGKKSGDDDDVATSTPAPAPAPVATAPAPAPAPVATVAPPAPPAPPAASYTPPAPPAPVADASRERVSGLSPSAAPAPVYAPAANPAPVATAAPVQQQPAAVAPPAADPTSPLGVWATEDGKGNVRIEQCGANLCGYGEKSNEKILINMKPSQNKWVGRIHDPDSGSNYDSTIALKGPNLLKVQGCAFGGMFCGGQTWKRVS
jgi:uncharacterized protein (DUF2147 family)